MPPIDISGQRFGRVTALKRDHSAPHNGYAYWICLCDCGRTFSTRGANLRSGNTSSCGCYTDERRSDIAERKRTHGDSQSAEWRTWRGIRRRCYDPTHKDYPRYGGVGVRICEEWRSSYQAFLSYVGRRPTARHSIDRFPNNQGDYEPGNVRWADPKQQQRNRRNNRLLTLGTVTKPVSEWAELVGMNDTTVLYRLSIGCGGEDALNLRPKQGRKLPTPSNSESAD